MTQRSVAGGAVAGGAVAGDAAAGGAAARGDVQRGALPAAAVMAVLRRPSLWWTALVVCRRLAPPGWWRRRPYLPLPDPSYWNFRMVTAYGGDGDAPPEPDDLVTYLEWRRAWPRVSRRR